LKIILFIFAIGALVFSESFAQTGACCVGLECVGNMEEWQCRDLDGYWFEGEDCHAGFDCHTAYPCGHFIMGDWNGDGTFNIADVIAAFSKLMTGSPDAYLLCECPPGSGNIWAVIFDLNDSCTFNVADVIIAFPGLLPPHWEPCHFCPPLP